MENIRYLLKIGESRHLKDFIDHKLYFNNAVTLRGIEETLQRKGQGDRLEGSAKVFATNTSIRNENGSQIINGVKGNFLFHFEPANNIPIFCLFSVFDKDCTIGENGVYNIALSKDTKKTIRDHFPKADAVIVIADPVMFLNEVQKSIGVPCKIEPVKYFNIANGIEVSGSSVPAMDIEYMKYLMQDVPPKIVGNKKTYSLRAEYVYRSLFCKDVFFKGEQELRIVLPNEKINTGTKYPVRFSEQLQIHELDSFLENH